MNHFTVPVAIVSLSKRNYAALTIERRSNFSADRKANSVLDTSEGMARRTTESDNTYVGWLRGRYKKPREGSYGHQWGVALGILVMPWAKTALERERMPRESRQEQRR